MWMRYYRAPAAAPTSNGGANINVTLPASDNSNNTSGAAQDSGTMPQQ